MLCEEYHRRPDLNFVNTCQLIVGFGTLCATRLLDRWDPWVR